MRLQSFVKINSYLKCYYVHKVTGAGQGIGRQLALEFWEQGSTVLCVDIDEEGNQFTVRTINAMVSRAAKINCLPIS